MDNELLLEELKKIAASEEMPAKVTNRLVLAGVIHNTKEVNTLCERENEQDVRIGRLETWIKVLSGLLVAILGWTIFA